MARGVGAQISLLAVFTAILILITAIAVLAFDVAPDDDRLTAPDGTKQPGSFGFVLWRSLMHALDPGTLGGDPGSWTFWLIMLFATIGGLFVLSALIGVLTQG